MSNILNKISSIEANDDIASKALGLRPADTSSPIERISGPNQDDPIPAIISRDREIYGDDGEPNARWPLILTVTLSVIWLIAAFFIANGFFNLSAMSDYSPVQLGGLAMFVIFPVLLLGLLHLTLKQLTKITARANKLDASANALMKVDDTVVRRATEMSGVIKGEISSLNAGIDTALTRAATLQGILDDQMEKLGETSYAVEDKTKKITKRLATEREALWAISNTFDEQMKALTQTLDTHSENLAMSTKTAEQKIQEARVSIESTASKINTTSELVRSNTMEAASTLTDNQTEILRLSEQLKARAQELDTIYQKHGADLNAMIAQLRNEQEDLNQSLEERLTKMRDVALSAQVSAERLTEASIAGRDTVTSLSEAAKISENTIKQRFTEMEDMVKYSNDRAESISAKASRRVQDSLAQTRKEISRIEADMLGLQEKLADTAAPSSDPGASLEPINEEPSEDAATPDAPDVLGSSAPNASEQKVDRPKRGLLNLRPSADEHDETSVKDDSVKELRPAPPVDPDLDPDLHYLPADLEATDDAMDELIMPEPDGLNLMIDDGLIKPVHTNPAEPETVEAQSDAPSEDHLRRTISEPETSGGWLKSMFGRGNKGADSSAIDAITRVPEVQPRESVVSEAAAEVVPEELLAEKPLPETIAEPQNEPAQTEPLSHARFLKNLERNGLGPNAIVDTGTIIDAVNARLSGGSKQMSVTVADRLGEPVSHFDKLINSDQELKAHAINFAVKFHHSLSPFENSGDALRNHFESEDGRLFLMCDAALNT